MNCDVETTVYYKIISVTGFLFFFNFSICSSYTTLTIVLEAKRQAQKFKHNTIRMHELSLRKFPHKKH